MCGIVGIVSKTSKVNQQALQAATNAIAHRGPDFQSIWLNKNQNIGFGHNRLSIIDLSKKAHQPLQYLNRYTIIYNGEIYNYLELKNKLASQKFQFNTESDTEIILIYYHLYKQECVNYFDGMFAFAIYDAYENKIFCARDRYGEKPFFFNFVPNQQFAFASEIKALDKLNIPKTLNHNLAFNYLLYGYIENPDNISQTFYDNIFKLQHGHYLEFDISSFTYTIKQYYNLEVEQKQFLDSEAIEVFDELLNQSIQYRLRSDVAVGCSLSGGLDSGTIATKISRIKNENFNCFSAIFKNYELNEEEKIKLLVENKTINSYLTEPTENNFIEYFQKVCYHQEEPFYDTSIMAQFFVMQLAKEKNTKVLLDGQGADELLAGYNSFLQPYFNQLKTISNEEFKEQKKYFTIDELKFAKNLKQFIPKKWHSFFHYTKINNEMKLSGVLTNDFIAHNKSTYFNANVFMGNDLNKSLHAAFFKLGLQQLLRFADRNSMANGVEIRLPFLQKDLVEFCFALPYNFKIRNGFSKWILRQSQTELPNQIRWNKQKIGFATPHQSIMQNKEWQSIFTDSVHYLKSLNIINASKSLQNITPTNKIFWRIMVLANCIKG